MKGDSNIEVFSLTVKALFRGKTFSKNQNFKFI